LGFSLDARVPGPRGSRARHTELAYTRAGLHQGWPTGAGLHRADLV